MAEVFFETGTKCTDFVVNTKIEESQLDHRHPSKIAIGRCTTRNILLSVRSYAVNDDMDERNDHLNSFCT